MRTGFWAVVLLAGVAVTLIAQFLLDRWADQYETAHWVQHGLLFASGIVAGSAILRLYQLGRRAA